MTDFLLLAFIFLVAGTFAVPLASRLGLGSVLGYLMAGIAISPLLALLGVDLVSIQHFAEFGVVMMLFLVGLELEPKILWQMRNRLVGLGGLQVAATAAAVTGVALWLGQPPTIAIAIGLILSLSSTAIVLQTLNERGLIKSEGGQASFSVLLFQDIAVIPMLAFIPLLASPDLIVAAADTVVNDAATALGTHSEGGTHGTQISLVDGLENREAALVTLAAIVAVFVIGGMLTNPILRYIAKARLRELFTAAALMIVVGIALLMSLVGLSPALGTFLAGVVLANSEFRHELESDIDPFRGLLLGLFFMTVGAGINFTLLADNLAVIMGLSFGLIALKVAILFVLGRFFGVTGGDQILFALGLAQAGEFGFVLLSFSVANSVLPQAVADQLALIVAISMLLTPLLFVLYDKAIAPRFSRDQGREADTITHQSEIIIAGHGRFGGIINRLLRATGFTPVVVDYNSEQLQRLKAIDLEIYYGDATRPDLLKAAGIETAKLLVVAIDGKEQITELVKYVIKTYPHVHVLSRAVDRDHIYELWGLGCRDIIRETYDSSIRAARSALEAIGLPKEEAVHLAQLFEAADRRSVAELADLYDPDLSLDQNKPYADRIKELQEESERQLRGEWQSEEAG